MILKICFNDNLSNLEGWIDLFKNNKKQKINKNNEKIDLNKNMKENIKFNNESFQKNNKTKKIFNIIFLLFIVSIILIGSFFSIFKAEVSNYDINYKGGYGLNIIVQNKSFDKNGNPTLSNTNQKEAVSLLKSKLDPLNNKNIVYRSWQQPNQDNFWNTDAVVNVQTSKSTYNNSIFDFINSATRPGYLYFTDKTKGKDLLIDSSGSSRTIISDIIGNVSSGVDKNSQNSPIVNLTIKDTDTWNTKIINQSSSTTSSSDDSSKEFIIWTDLAYFVNDLRNIDDYDQFNSLAIELMFSSMNNKDDMYPVFNYTTQNNSGITETHNLIDDYNNSSVNNRQNFINELKLDKNSEWKIPLSSNSTDSDNSGSLEQGMNSNNPASVDSKYIDPFRPYFWDIINKKPSINVDNEFNKYELADESNPQELSSDNIYSISSKSSFDSKNSAALINSGIHGLEFNLDGSYNIAPLITTVQFKISLFIFIAFIFAIIVFLIAYYRLFGLICSLGMILMLAISYLLIGFLAIEIGPALILSILVILFLFIDSNINFFEHFRKEYHQQNVSNSQSYKLANKKTFLTIIDYHLIILFLGLAIFIFSNNALRMFGISIIILTLISFITSIFIVRLLYFYSIKSKLLEEFRFLRMPKNLKLIFNFNKKNNFNKINKNEIDINNVNNNSNNLLVLKEKNETKNVKFINSISNYTKSFKNKKNKLSIIFFSFFVSLLIVSCFLFGIYGVRFGQETIHGSNWNTGTTFLINDTVDASSTISSDVNKLNGAIKDKYDRKFDYSVYAPERSQNNTDYNILLITNVQFKSNLYNEIFEWLNSENIQINYNLYLTVNNDSKIISASYSDTVKQLLIIFGVVILIVLIYILFRFNWSQFITVLGSLIFAIILTILVVNVTHVWITLEMLLALLGVMIYVIVDGIILCSKIKYEKVKYKNDNFIPIYKKYLEYKKHKREYREYFKIEYDKEINKLILSDNKYSNSEFLNQKSLIKEEVKSLLESKKEPLKQQKIEYKKILRDNNINYLFKIKYSIIKENIKRSILTSIIFTTLILILMLSGGVSIGFGIVVLFGVNIAIFGALIILLTLWLIFDKYNIITNLKIKNFLKKRKLELDEEDVEGINI